MEPTLESTREALDHLAGELAGKSDKRAGRKIRIHIEAVFEKLWQAEFALSKMKDTEPETDRDSLGRMQFYVEALCNSLFSAYDVLTQVIDQRIGHIGEEGKVSLSRLAEKLKPKPGGPPLPLPLAAIHKDLRRLLKSATYRRLRKYRHCMTHRRPNCILQETQKLSGPYERSGVSGVLKVPRWYICDDPERWAPKFAKKQEILPFCGHLLRSVERHVTEVASTILRSGI